MISPHANGCHNEYVQVLLRPCTAAAESPNEKSKKRLVCSTLGFVAVVLLLYVLECCYWSSCLSSSTICDPCSPFDDFLCAAFLSRACCMETASPTRWQVGGMSTLFCQLFLFYKLYIDQVKNDLLFCEHLIWYYHAMLFALHRDSCKNGWPAELVGARPVLTKQSTRLWHSNIRPYYSRLSSQIYTNATPPPMDPPICGLKGLFV